MKSIQCWNSQCPSKKDKTKLWQDIKGLIKEKQDSKNICNKCIHCQVCLICEHKN